MKTFEEILKAKRKRYGGKSEDAIKFAAEEYARRHAIDFGLSCFRLAGIDKMKRPEAATHHTDYLVKIGVKPEPKATKKAPSKRRG